MRAFHLSVGLFYMALRDGKKASPFQPNISYYMLFGNHKTLKNKQTRPKCDVKLTRIKILFR
jgi:hypothetical protein